MNYPLPTYFLKRSARSRHIRLRVEAGGHVTVSAPARATDSTIKNFLEGHASWLRAKVEYFKKIPEPTLARSQEKKLFESHKYQAKALAEHKLKQWNERYGFSFKKVAIRNSRSRWGSCSSSGTISFNYKIAFLPEALADYLVVHELCHF